MMKTFLYFIAVCFFFIRAYTYRDSAIGFYLIQAFLTNVLPLISQRIVITLQSWLLHRAEDAFYALLQTRQSLSSGNTAIILR